MSGVPAFAVDGRQLISRRGGYFGGMRVGADDLPMRLSIVRRSGDRAEPETTTATFDLWLVQQLGESDFEATQQVASAEGEKLYAFDRIVRMVNVQAVLYDTARDRALRGAIARGRGHREWKRFYERARLSQIARRGELVRMECRGVVWYGAFTTQVLSQTSGDPHRVDLAATFLAVESSSPGAAPRKLPLVDVYGRLTAEGATAVGLLPSLTVDPATTPSFGPVAQGALLGAPVDESAAVVRVDEEFLA